ncbi:MAG TPA: hypothetical protein VIZ30_00390, partial [Pseudomonadales bacterium]
MRDEMSARVEDGTGTPSADESPNAERPPVRLRARTPGLDLICTKVAVDLQSVGADTVAARIPAGLQALTDAYGVDSVFVALLDHAGTAIEKVYAGRSTFSAFNPEVLQGRQLEEFPWLKARLAHLRLLEIKDTAKGSEAQK